MKFQDLMIEKTANEKLRETIPYFEDKTILIYKDDFLKTTAIPPSSIDLIVTSPPYNVDIHYNTHRDNLSYENYLEFTKEDIRKDYTIKGKVIRPANVKIVK